MAGKPRQKETEETLLVKELNLAGIARDDPKLFKSALLVAELHHCVKRHLHEGRMPHYGAIFSKTEIKHSDFEITTLKLNQIELARQLSDGIRSFVVYVQDAFVGLGTFKSQGLDEFSLVEFLEQAKIHSMIVGDGSGTTRLIRSEGIAVHQHRVWYEKPSVDSVLNTIYACAPQAPHGALKQILFFALHSLSPRRVGATLVLTFQTPTPQEFEMMRPQLDLTPFNLNPSDSAKRAILRHLLAQTDGATILDSQGVVIGTGAHLKFSQKSVDLIRQLKGTRHTSAKRFSYDFAPGLIITVSADGPVTVFSDGVNIAELNLMSAARTAKSMQKAMPFKRDDIDGGSYTETCSKCGKSSVVEELVVIGWKDREEAHCPVCNEEIASAMCFSISAHVIKKL